MRSFLLFLFTDWRGLSYFLFPVLLAFACQLLLCHRAKRLLSRAALLLTALSSLLLALALRFWVFGISYGFYALFHLGLGVLLLFGSLMGWLVYEFWQWLRAKKASSR